MNRRAFITGVGAMLTAPLAAEAQQASGKVARIAFLSITSAGQSPAANAFRQGLRDLGYVEGQNIVVEWRWAGGRPERFPDFAAEMVRLNVDAIVVTSDPAGHAAQRLTKTIPIVIPFMTDPIGDGFATTLARPGGNITGLTNQSADLTAKRLQVFQAAIPNVRRMALLTDATDQSYRRVAREAGDSAHALGLQLDPREELSSASELEGAFDRIISESAAAVFVVGGTMLFANRTRLAEHALKRRLPMMCWLRDYVEVGCLMSYAPNLLDLFRRAATYIDKILKGTKPADLPIEQPTKFEFVINLKTAKALGLTIPQSLLLRADQLIE